MILAHDDLVKAWEDGTISFTPNIGLEQIGLSSIDLHLGWVFTRLIPRRDFAARPAQGFDPTGLVEHQDLSTLKILGKPPTFTLEPQEFRLALTHESIRVPPGLAASVQGKSSLARAGLAVHITAPHIHPGFEGPIALELYNHSPWELQFFPGEDLICQVVYYEVRTPVADDVIDGLSTFRGQATPFPGQTT